MAPARDTPGQASESSRRMIADGDQQHAERSAIVLYGSETGNAQEVAEELGRMAERLHFVTHVSEMNAVKAVRPSKAIAPGMSRLLMSSAGISLVLYVDLLRCFDHRPG